MVQELWLKTQELLLRLLRSFQQLSPLHRLIVASCVIALIPGFFIAKYVSYGLWYANYKQYLVTAHPSFTEAEDVIASPVTILDIGSGSYAAYATVTNQNLDLSFQKAHYQFNFYNSSKEKIETATGSLFLLPNKQTYVMVARIAPKEAITAATLELSDIAWQKKVSLPTVRLNAPSPSLRNTLSPLTLVAEGAVTNQSPYRLATIRLLFLLYDSSDQVIAVSERNEFNVEAYERRAYVQRWPSLYQDQVARIQVIAETNTLDGNNVALQTYDNGASDLSRPEFDSF